MYILRMKNLPRAIIAGLAMECIRLLTEYGSESELVLDIDLKTLPEMYEVPKQETENTDESRP